MPVVSVDHVAVPAHHVRELIDFFSNASFNEVPADIDALGAMLEAQGGSGAIREILDFYLESSVNTRLSQDLETLKSSLFEAEQALNTDAHLAASLQQAGNVDEVEMLRTFNCGIGFVVCVADSAVDEAVAALTAAGEEPRVIGRVVEPGFVPASGQIRLAQDDYAIG